MCATLIIWLFVMRTLMIVTSLVSYFVNEGISKAMFGGKKDFDFEAPLTHLVWITSAVSIARHLRRQQAAARRFETRGDRSPALWWVLSVIISCGTVAGALIPEFTKVFTSTNSRHVAKRSSTASKHGGASLNILSGFVAGNFSAFWMGLHHAVLMFVALSLLAECRRLMSLMPAEFLSPRPIFAFGLVAFGFLGMGPVTIAVDSFGPVTDNAQSVYELSQIEGRPNIKDEIKQRLRFRAGFRKRQASTRKRRRRGQHLQGHGQAGAHRHGGGRRDHDGVRHHHAAGTTCSATATWSANARASCSPKSCSACSWAAR